MKICALRYQFDRLSTLVEYRNKIEVILKDKKSQGIDLVLFPEYAGLELLAIFDDPLKDSYKKLNTIYQDYCDLFTTLSKEVGIHVCAGTTVVLEGGKRYNRAHLFTKDGKLHVQDKCMSTRFEIEKEVSQGRSYEVFEVGGLKLAVVICYDMEFPSIARNLCEQGAELLLCPSYTDDWQGYYRVHVASRARALENQCFVATSVLHGKFDWVDEEASGFAGIYAAPDGDFPDSGILYQDEKDALYQIDRSLINKTRETGSVLIYKDWPDQFSIQYS